MNWGILGIDPTSDKKLITQAYRAALVNANPEEKPEEFKALRAAYEEALELSKKAQSETDDQEPMTPVDAWIRSVRKVYDHFPSRISPDPWRKLLQDDVCIALDTRPAAEEALLLFLMDDCRLSWAVWKVLGDEFSWLERIDELKERFPSDFIEYVIENGIRYGEFLPCDLFDPGQDAAECDEYINVFTQARRLPPDEALESVRRLETLTETHPYGQALIGCMAARSGDRSVIDSLVALTQDYPDHEYIVGTVAHALHELGEFELGQQICRAFLEIKPDNNDIPYVLARCLAGAGEYAAGVEILNDLMAHAGGNDIVLNDLSDLRKEWNNALIGQYEQAVADNPQDSNKRFELAWCYLQNDRVDEAWDVAQPIVPEELDAFAYNNLVSQIHYVSSRYEEALAMNDVVIEVICSYGGGVDDEQKKRVARLPEKLMLRATILELLGRRDEAKVEFEQALALTPDDANQLNRIARYYLGTHDYQRARDHAWHLTEVLPNAYHGHLTLAYAAYGLHDDREAFEAVNRAIDEDGSDLSEYVLKLQILVRNGAFEQARALIDYLRENGAGQAPGVRLVDGKLAEFEEKDYPKAVCIYEEVAQLIEDGDYIYEPGEVFFRLAFAKSQTLDMSKDGSKQEILGILDRGLEKQKDHLDCMDYKAWLLQRLGRNREALDVLLTMEKDPSHDGDVERQLAEMYRKDLGHRADKALRYFQMLLEDEPESAELLFYAGICLTRLNRYEEAEQMFLREEKVEPDSIDPHRGLFDVCMALGKYEEALRHVDRCIEISKGENKSFDRFLRDRVKALRRMGLPDQAVATARELAQYDLGAASRLIFDIYAQFGDLGSAKAHLKDKTMNPRGAQERTQTTYMLFLLPLLQRRYIKAELVFLDRSASMSQSDRQEGRILLDALDGKFDREIERRHADLEKCADSDYDALSHIYMNLAEAYWYAGNVEQARVYAAKGLEACDGALAEFSTCRPLFMTRKACVLALLGRFGEADELLGQARSLPLCSHCPYGSCKDADLFETVILSLRGDNAAAVDKCDEYLAKWPDEMEFVVQKRYSEKRI